MPQHATTDTDIERCYDVMAELRGHIEREEFLPLVRHMETEGYRLCFHEHAGSVVAVAGYRIFRKLFKGKNLYVDDLVTAESERSKGYGEVLVSWLREIAHEEQCVYFNLDSGTQRHHAHRFYFRHGFRIDSYHFGEDVGE